ncbi:uroporphyrinogen decarboxylase [Aquidulcibacter sp.]|jgi:uroporphyrinogen decarboxylase|uniref:uroporphyrinogen decarboxylase n=1 Tax=Aquidulcibacter sp. TaxID=2052990 RepID=UPI0028AB25D3|nr:uroporphyrinogen decarboxylase [Aquidulcibacter sp.]
MGEGAKGYNSALVRTLLGEQQTHPPIWLMRQAGRHLPEYRELRAKNKSFLDFCYAPAAAAEATLQPVRRYPVDAAIIFSDILVVPHALGRDVRFAEGEGPLLTPLEGAADIAKLDMSRLETRLAPVYEALERVRAAMDGDRALIGFAGAPWTLATYMIQGRGGERDLARAFAYQNPELVDDLLAILADAIGQHLIAQVKAGANALQIFESWAEDIPGHLFARLVTKPIKQAVDVVRGVYPDVPIIGFPRGAGHRVGQFFSETTVQGVGLDIAADLGAARTALGPKVCLQGNLDPMALMAGGPALEQAVDAILAAAATGPHIFNLGHGVVPATPITNVEYVMRRVKGLT